MYLQCAILLDRLATSLPPSPSPSVSLTHSLSLSFSHISLLSFSLFFKAIIVYPCFIFEPLCQVYGFVLISHSRVSRNSTFYSLFLYRSQYFFSLSVSLSVFLRLYLSPFVSRSFFANHTSYFSLSFFFSSLFYTASTPYRSPSLSLSLSFSVSEVFIDVP